MGKKNLVLGAIKGYAFEKIETFVASLKNTSFDGDLCLLVNGVPPDTINQLQKRDVICEPMNYRGGGLNSWSRFWPIIKPVASFLPNSIMREVFKKITPLQTARFLHYKDFLIKNKHVYHNVLLTDVRDVFFQADPFLGHQYDKIQCYEELTVLGEETYFNVPWIETLYGKNAADSFAHEKILCVGTILGPIEKVIEFLDEFEKNLVRGQDVSIVGTDQGSFNYLIRNFLFNQVDIVKYNDGEVITISPFDDYTNRIKDNYFCNTDNQIVPVVHQYDRSEIVNDALQHQLQ